MNFRDSSDRRTVKRAIFLDRDGTINVEKNYLINPDDFVLLPGVGSALRLAHEAGFLLIVVTNQSGIARGFFTKEQVSELHTHLQSELVPYQVQIDDFYLCPHHPDFDQDQCDCRKGEPGMLLRAAIDHGIDLRSSWMIGDKLSDIEAGRRAGCRSILVRTGYGEHLEADLLQGVQVADSFEDAVALILRS